MRATPGGEGRGTPGEAEGRGGQELRDREEYGGKSNAVVCEGRKHVEGDIGAAWVADAPSRIREVGRGFAARESGNEVSCVGMRRRVCLNVGLEQEVLPSIYTRFKLSAGKRMSMYLTIASSSMYSFRSSVSILSRRADVEDV